MADIVEEPVLIHVVDVQEGWEIAWGGNAATRLGAVSKTSTGPSPPAPARWSGGLTDLPATEQ